MVAMMLTFQPLIMGGFDDIEVATSNAYGAMICFFFTFLVSVVYLIKDALTTPVGGGRERSRRSGQGYEGIIQDTDPAIFQEYAMNLDLPPSVQSGFYS
jgi:hypothetical protein